MTPRSLWIILLKLAGIGLLFIFATKATELIGMLLYFTSRVDDLGYLFGSLATMTMSAAVYLYFLNLCFFRTEWVIDRLKLDKGFNQEKIDLKISPHTIRVATIIVGCLLVIEAVPAFLGELVQHIQRYDRIITDVYVAQAHIIISKLISGIIGYLMIANSAWIAQWITRKDKREETTALPEGK